MKTEAKFWEALRDKVLKRNRVHWLRLEDAAMRGLPDLYIARGGRSAWIELKLVPKLPARETTPIRTTTTSEQVEQLRQMRKLGGMPSWLLVAIDERAFLFEPIEAKEVQLGAPFARWRQLATHVVALESLLCRPEWHMVDDQAEFLRVLFEEPLAPSN